jgi:hypothetical protein
MASSETTNIYEYGVKAILLSFKSSGTTTTWAASHAYALNDTVTASGNLYKVTTAGTSGSTVPTWPASGTVTDGTSLVWTYVSAASGYESPIQIYGPTELKIALKTNQDTLYAADGVWATINSVSSATITLKYYQTIAKAIRARMLGHKTDANGIGYMTNIPTPEEFALGAIFEGAAQNYLRWFYRCQAIDPDEDRTTVGEKIEAAENEMSILATPKEIGDEKIICSDPIGSIDDKAVFDTYASSVYVAAATTDTLTTGA